MHFQHLLKGQRLGEVVRRGAQRVLRLVDKPGTEELVDSAVTAIVQAFLDSVTPVPGSVVASLPKWTTEIGGKKFGIDGSNIYIAGLKIPTAVLAFLPLQGGNIDQSRRYNDLMDMRSDIYNAARRADNLEEFKQVIEEICSIVDGPISAEAVSLEAGKMVAEGEGLAKIHKNVVVKVPRFDFAKFPTVPPVLGTTMRSVGEAMAIGRTFPEA